MTLRARFHGIPKILVTACVPEDDIDARTTGPCALSERMGCIFAAQHERRCRRRRHDEPEDE